MSLGTSNLPLLGFGCITLLSLAFSARDMVETCKTTGNSSGSKSEPPRAGLTLPGRRTVPAVLLISPTVVGRSCKSMGGLVGGHLQWQAEQMMNLKG